jgi:hypothetical protein
VHVVLLLGEGSAGEALRRLPACGASGCHAAIIATVITDRKY